MDTDGNGIEIQNLAFVKRVDRGIDELKKRRDKCLRNSIKIERQDGSYSYRPSRRWGFFQQRLDELHRVRRDQIKSALFCLSNQLESTYDLVGVGNYTPQGGGISRGMRRAMNNQSQIGKFKTILSWVCQREGKRYLEWDEYNSTKLCSQCQAPTDLTKDTSVRIWQCKTCGVTHYRDENASLNGFKQVARKIKTQQVPCSGHLREKIEAERNAIPTQRCAWRITGSGVKVLPFIPRARDAMAVKESSFAETSDSQEIESAGLTGHLICCKSGASSVPTFTQI